MVGFIVHIIAPNWFLTLKKEKVNFLLNLAEIAAFGFYIPSAASGPHHAHIFLGGPSGPRQSSPPSPPRPLSTALRSSSLGSVNKPEAPPSCTGEQASRRQVPRGMAKSSDSRCQGRVGRKPNPKKDHGPRGVRRARQVIRKKPI